MGIYKDLSVYINSEKNTVNIGWLGDEQFNTGDVKKEFLDCLWEYIKCPIRLTRQIYKNCKLDDKQNTFTACYNGYEVLLGSAEIRVIGRNNSIVYASPNLILHYIINHNYLPPEEYIEAVINGPKPNSEEYCGLVREIYANYPKKNNSRLICPYCNGRNNYFAPSIKKNYDIDSDIKVIRTDEINKDKLGYNDYHYNVVCEDCGKMYRVEYETLIGR